jgi:hypothetical protein
MRGKWDILWRMMVLVPLIMGISLTTSDWAVCKDVIPDEYMDLSSVIEQDTEQSIFRYIHIIDPDFVGASAASYLSYPMSGPVPQQHRQSGHWTPLSLACTSVGRREPRATDQLCVNAFLFACNPEYSSNGAFPPHIAKISLYSEQPLTVILRI